MYNLFCNFTIGSIVFGLLGSFITMLLGFEELSLDILIYSSIFMFACIIMAIAFSILEID